MSLFPAACQRSAPPPEAGVTVPVEVTEVFPQDLEETTQLTGILDAWRAVDVVSEVPGKVTVLARDVGDAVSAGSVLASLEKKVRRETLNQAEAAVLAAEARQNLAADEYQRDSTLFAQGDIAQAAIDASRLSAKAALADLLAARAARELAARELREADVRAPFKGIVSRRFCEIGGYVTPGTPLFRLVDIDSLRLVLSVAQRHLARLAAGEEVTLNLEARPGESYTGRIRSISPEADESTRAFPVEVVLANPPGRPLRDGLVVRARLVLDRREQVLTVPRESVQQRGDSVFVFVQVDSLARRRAVKISPLIGDRYVVEEGLAAGERLVTAGMQNLRHGARVTVERVVPAGGRRTEEIP